MQACSSVQLKDPVGNHRPNNAVEEKQAEQETPTELPKAGCASHERIERFGTAQGFTMTVANDGNQRLAT
jgi:hypothetical protein